MPAFEIDERKLRKAMDASPAARTLDDDVRDLAMVGRLIAGPLLLLLAVVLLVGALLSFL